MYEHIDKISICVYPHIQIQMEISAFNCIIFCRERFLTLAFYARQENLKCRRKVSNVTFGFHFCRSTKSPAFPGDCVCVIHVSHSVVFNSLRPQGLYPSGLLCPWNSPGKNTGVNCHSLLQGILLTQESKSGFLNCSQILYHLNRQGSPSGFRWGVLFSCMEGWLRVKVSGRIKGIFFSLPSSPPPRPRKGAMYHQQTNHHEENA